MDQGWHQAIGGRSRGYHRSDAAPSRAADARRGAAMTADLPATAAPTIPTLKMLIDGVQVAAAGGETLDVVSPVDGTVIARVAKGGAEDVDRAVVAAQRAFDGEWHTWSQTRRGQ